MMFKVMTLGISVDGKETRGLISRVLTPTLSCQEDEEHWWRRKKEQLVWWEEKKRGVPVWLTLEKYGSLPISNSSILFRPLNLSFACRSSRPLRPCHIRLRDAVTSFFHLAVIHSCFFVCNFLFTSLDCWSLWWLLVFSWQVTQLASHIKNSPFVFTDW